MNKNLLIVVDMQNDFIDGSLGSKEAQAIVEPMRDFISKWEGDIIFTVDTHKDNYLETQEGKHLPVPHCIKGTNGIKVNSKLLMALESNTINCYAVVDKSTFCAGEDLSDTINDMYDYDLPDNITLVGVCTDICVVSNALYLKYYYPETPIKVIANLCAGVTPEKHEAALETMRSCQIEVV